MRRPYVYIHSTEGKPASSHRYQRGRYVSGRAVRPLPPACRASRQAAGRRSSCEGSADGARLDDTGQCGGMSGGPDVEAQIRAAQARGDFDDLPGKGKPLKLPDVHDPNW